MNGVLDKLAPRVARRRDPRAPRTMNEFELIERYFHRAPRNADVRIGIGDDGAVFAPSPGMEYVRDGRHARRGPAFRRGRESAVASATRRSPSTCPTWPQWARCRASCCSPARCQRPIPRGLPHSCAGSTRSRAQYDVELIGGDTTRGPRTLCVTAIGELPAGTALTRSGASPGDVIYVSGRLGDAALALAVARGRTDVDAAAAAGAGAEARLPAAARRARRCVARRRLRRARCVRWIDRRSRPHPDRFARRRDARFGGDSVLRRIADEACGPGTRLGARRACSPAATTTSSVSPRRRRCANASTRLRSRSGFR